MSSNNGLTQDEIDALLAGTGDLDDKPLSQSAQSITQEKINTSEISTFVDLLNSMLQYQTSQFTSTFQRGMLHSRVMASIKDSSQIASNLDGKIVQIRMEYHSGIQGDNIYIFKLNDALKLAEIVLGQTGIDLNETAITALNECISVMNNVGNEFLSRKFNRVIATNPPQIEILENSSMIKFPSISQVVHISYNFNPDNSAPIAVHQLCSVPMVKELINMARGSMFDEGYGADLSGGAYFGSSDRAFQTITNVRPVQYASFEETTIKNPAGSINLLVDIFMQLTVELGRTKMQVKEIMNLSEGSIIELEKLAGEPVDLLVNGKLVAKGEVVVIDENFGVRVTEIVSPHARIEISY